MFSGPGLRAARPALQVPLAVLPQGRVRVRQRKPDHGADHRGRHCAHPESPGDAALRNLTHPQGLPALGVRRLGDSPRRARSPAPPGGTWSDMEMHDAMIVLLVALRQHGAVGVVGALRRPARLGPGLGGIMFDDIGPNHRQGTAIFYNSFISDAAARRSEPRGVHRPQPLLDGGARDGARVQPRALLAEIARRAVTERRGFRSPTSPKRAAS